MGKNPSKALFTIAAITAVAVGTPISTSLAKADTFILTQNIPSPQPQSDDQNAGSVATVVADTKVYSAPETSSKVVKNLPRGTRVVVLNSVIRGNTTWYWLVSEYWGEGWIEGKYLSLIPQTQNGKVNTGSVAIVTSDADARVFSGPGTDYIVRTFLAKGTKVLVLDSVIKGDTTWYKIGDKNQVQGWVQGDNLSLSSQPPSGSQNSIDAATDLVFQTSSYAVRVYRQGEQTLMNVFDKGDKVTFLRGTPVTVEPNPEGYNYTNTSGEVKVKVFQSRNSNTHSIQVGKNSPELSF